MADKKVKAEAVKAEPQAADPKFTIEALRKHCYELFGITSSTFDGATYGLEGPLTKAEAQKAINKWLGKE